MTQLFRAAKGGRIDRSKPISFQFNGKRYQGYQGDTLASALIANGIHLVGRSFKYHRPRGIMGSGVEEPNAMVQINPNSNRTDPNQRATVVELYDDLSADSQNCWPSVEFDVGAVNNMLMPFFPAGFYYKTFMFPATAWEKYEHVIRKAAGLGMSPTEEDPDRYEHIHAHCDVLVVGAGPAGLMAARAAAATGARVILADEQHEMGGSLLAEDVDGIRVDGSAAGDWATGMATVLAGHGDVTLLPRTTAFGYFDNNWFGLLERVTDHLGREAVPGQVRARMWRVRARQVVLATGSHERPLVFDGNDRPGVMLASAARTYINRYGALAGQRPVVFTNNDSAYKAALDMHNKGARVVAIVDLREDPKGELVQSARDAGIQVLTGHTVVATSGGKRVTGVEVRQISNGIVGPDSRPLVCDLVLMSGGWNPAVHLFSQSRGKLAYNADLGVFVPGQSVQAERSAGACNGAFGTREALEQGAAAGLAAATEAGFTGEAPTLPAVQEWTEGPMAVHFLAPSHKRDSHRKGFVDFQNDVKASDILLAVREGFHSVEHVKRYTTTGMGTDQGRTSNINALGIVAEALGKTPPEVGTTTFRPAYTAVPFGAISGPNSGDLFDPVRTTPMHKWHLENGAEFEDVGQWKRAWFYPKKGEDMHRAVNREVEAARQGIGILDASTLGKIEVRGRDAAEFLNRVYTNAWTKLAVGRCRYGLMLGEDGMVRDDGVTARLGEDRFLMTTTTGNAAMVMAWLEEWLQTEWPEMEVYLTSVTEQWATITINGPKSRDLLTKVASGTDFSNEGFPHMAIRDAEIAGVAGRIARISFTGEMSYEINVPARYGLHVWETLMHEGEPYDITPYGTEAMHVLRAEKGFIIVGQETDGSMTPDDLGMDWIVSKKKPQEFLGKRSLSRQDMLREDRKQLVGLLTSDPTVILEEGAQLVDARDKDNTAYPVPMIGHVTSSYWSPNVGRSIALAMVRAGRARIGTTIYAPMADKTIAVEVVEPVFFDKEGVRANG
ncbi:MAG: sarcosine oxidase subunit alpha [Alphaproteobacteria bacterium]|nr:sarcosine oxidase subunit alpha [Alphaproteobacteria bacterium]